MLGKCVLESPVSSYEKLFYPSPSVLPRRHISSCASKTLPVFFPPVFCALLRIDCSVLIPGQTTTFARQRLHNHSSNDINDNADGHADIDDDVDDSTNNSNWNDNESLCLGPGAAGALQIWRTHQAVAHPASKFDECIERWATKTLNLTNVSNGGPPSLQIWRTYRTCRAAAGDRASIRRYAVLEQSLGIRDLVQSTRSAQRMVQHVHKLRKVCYQLRGLPEKFVNFLANFGCESRRENCCETVVNFGVEFG